MKVSKLRELFAPMPADFEVVINASILDGDYCLKDGLVLVTPSGTDCHDEPVVCDEKNGLVYLHAESQVSYEDRVRAYEEKGCTRSDAQAIVDAEDLRRAS